MAGKLPSIVLRNQYGEISNNFVKSGSTNQIWCKFKVDSTNANGLGTSALTSSGITAKPDVTAVYMHTSSTPAAANPNPVAGNILVQFSKAFSSFINYGFGLTTPLSGSSVSISSGLTLGKAYVITAVGTSTAVNWQALGLPVGITPAVNAVFIATSASAGAGTGTVQLMATAAAGVSGLELVGDPSATCNPSTGGGYLVLAATYTTDALTAPADGTVIGLQFNMIPNPAPLI